MVAVQRPTDDEMALLAILQDSSGVDIAEFALRDIRNPDGCYRVHDYQWPWFTSEDKFQIDQGGRAVGKTESIKLRCMAFPFAHSGHSMLVTAPELNHLRPLTDEVEKFLLSTRLTREMMPDTPGRGIARQPHWQVRFSNGTSIISRLPNKDGRGVKGCLGAGAQVLTRRGHVPVEAVRVGDEVLTHAGRWRPVTKTYKFATNGEALQVRGAGHRGLVVSDSHAFYARRGRARSRDARSLGVPLWVDAVSPDVDRWYWASPTSVPATAVTGWPDDIEGSTRQLVALAGWWLARGRLVAGDGDPIVAIRGDEDDLRRAEQAATGAGYPVRRAVGLRDRTEVHVISGDLARWLADQFGIAHGDRKVPAWLLGAPDSYRQVMWDAYTRGHGHWNAGRTQWSSTMPNRRLGADLRLLAASLGYTTGLSWDDHERSPRQHRTYRFTASLDGDKAIEDGYVWGKISGVERVACDWVYDLSVQEDHSYVADGIVQHNQHVLQLELDEGQDYPKAGWREVIECLNSDVDGAMFRVHGVSRGVPDEFYARTQPNSGWTVHRPMAMMRPGWNKDERDSRIRDYGNSRQAVDYRRNVYGEHGDASNSVFVLSRLMDCVDRDEGSTYNSAVYQCIKFEYEKLPEEEDARIAYINNELQFPGSHKSGYSQKVRNKEVGSPKGYSAYWAGMDVGVTNHPSEILVFGQRLGSDDLELLTRVQMHRVNTDDQKLVIERIFQFYGEKLYFGIDKTGVGFPVWDQLTRMSYGSRVYGFGFSEKRVVAYEQRDLQPGETQEDLAIKRNMVEAATDWLRNDYVDLGKLRLPYDVEILTEFQGQSYSVVKDNGDPYGQRRLFSGGSLHSLDAAKVMVAARHIPQLEAMLAKRAPQEDAIDIFIGAF